MLLLCVVPGCRSSANTVAELAMSGGQGQSVPTITSISLLRADGGFERNRWSESLITITPSRTIAEHATGSQPASRTEGRTSSHEWERLCQFISDSGLFSTRGETELASGDHAGDVELTVTFSDGSVSKVTHRAFNAERAPQVWSIVRVVEGSTLNTLPLADPPGWSK